MANGVDAQCIWLVAAQAASWWPVAMVVLAIVPLVALVVIGRELMLALQSRVAGAPVPVTALVAMRFRKVDSAQIVLSYIRMRRAGIDVSIDQLETHYLAGGNVPKVVSAMITAQSAGVPFAWDLACAIDCAGRDVVDAIETSVNPITYRYPEPGSGVSSIRLTAADGDDVWCRLELTLRTRPNRLIGGANERMIAERVESALRHIVSTMPTAADVSSSAPELVDSILALKPDAAAAYEIVDLRVLPA